MRAIAVRVHAVGDAVHCPVRYKHGGVRIEYEGFGMRKNCILAHVVFTISNIGVLIEHEKVARRIVVAATDTKVSARIAHVCRKKR